MFTVHFDLILIFHLKEFPWKKDYSKQDFEDIYMFMVEHAHDLDAEDKANVCA